MAGVVLVVALETVLVHVIQVALVDAVLHVVAIAIMHAAMDAIHHAKNHAVKAVKHTARMGVQVAKGSAMIYVDQNVTQLAEMIVLLAVKAVATWNAKLFAKMDVQRIVRLDVVDLA